VYTLGKWGVLGNVIFKNWRVEDCSEIKKIADNYKNGLDFGWEHPSAIVRTHYDKDNKKIYILDEFYQSHITDDILAREAIKMIGKEYVSCDAASPSRINEIKQYGVYTLTTKKGKDSVIHGIQWLQQHEIIIDKSCQNFKNEIQQYKWKEDKLGNTIQEPVKKNDDLIDSLRYAYESEMLASEEIIFT
jgi:phage terminase large subunit